MVSSNENAATILPRPSEPLAAIAEAVERMRFGVIQLTVHDGKLVQLDITEKRRFG